MVAIDALFEPRLPDAFPKLVKVYEKAKKDFWNETTDIDWDQEIDLPQDKREAMARLLSITYYGERAALTIAGQLVAMVPDEEAKQAIACQVIEEAKHVGVFQHLIGRLDKVAPPSPFARRLLTDLICTDDAAAKMVGMHLFVENIANHTFRTLREHIETPLIKQVLEYVARDEAKHTAIGVLYLPSLLDAMPAHRVAWLRYKQVKWLTLGLGMVKDGYKDARILNIDLAAAGKRALKDHYKLRDQLATTRGLIDIPGFEKIIDLIGDWASDDAE